MIGSGAEQEAAGAHSTDGNNIRKRRDGGEACSPEEEGHKKSRSLDEFYHHDELCKKFQLVFSHKGGSSHDDDDGHRCHQPTFLNQFYPECESVLAALAVVRSITLRVSLKSFRILISPEWEDGGEQLSTGVLGKLLQPLISKFPKGFSLPPHYV